MTPNPSASFDRSPVFVAWWWSKLIAILPRAASALADSLNSARFLSRAAFILFLIVFDDDGIFLRSSALRVEEVQMNSVYFLKASVSNRLSGKFASEIKLIIAFCTPVVSSGVRCFNLVVLIVVWLVSSFLFLAPDLTP